MFTQTNTTRRHVASSFHSSRLRPSRRLHIHCIQSCLTSCLSLRDHLLAVEPAANTHGGRGFPCKHSWWPSSRIEMLRRNGTRSSCEPCRKAKVKCDHRAPFCQRCEARGITANCIYHPAPLTRRSPAPDADGRRTNKRKLSMQQQYQGASGFGVLDLSVDSLSETALDSTQAGLTPALPSTQTPQALFSAPLATPANAASNVIHSATSNAIQSHNPSSFGGTSDAELNVQSTSGAPKAASSDYYGSTSYHSVFDRVDHVHPSGPAGDTLSASLQLGCWILQNLQHLSIIQSLVDTYMQTSQVSPTATLIPLKAVETLQHLASGDVDIHAAAQKTTRNSQKPLQVPPDIRASTFSTLFTGENLRWEFLGLVFAWAGLSLSMSLDGKGSATTPDGFSKTSFAQLLTACSDACITLCRQNALTSNDIVYWCLYENLILQTFQHGEASERISPDNP